MTEFHLGLDDIDSPRGGCTTHFASLIVEHLTRHGVEWQDYPNLIRLNPNIPYRTRGNGAVVLRFKMDNSNAENLMRFVREMIEQYVDLDYPNTNPGAVLVEGSPGENIRRLAELALWRVLSITVVRRVIGEEGLKHVAYGSGRGLIGAIAGIGNGLEEDHTFEYIAYRSMGETSRPRGVDADSVIEMNKVMGNKTFSNIDPQTGTVLIEPHGPDPVLYGLRGERPEDLVEAASMIRSKQQVDRWMIFRTNQGTAQHLRYQVRVGDLRPYMAAVVKGKIVTAGKMIEGGHLIFTISDGTGKIDCAAYEPTGEFRSTLAKLIPGDRVVIFAGTRPASRTHGLTLNVEGVEIVELADKIRSFNPRCPSCGKRMKSAGRDKGFKCPKCGHRERGGEKERVIEKRSLRPGLYLPPLRAHRHLTRPHARVGVRNSEARWPPTVNWYSF